MIQLISGSGDDMCDDTTDEDKTALTWTQMNVMKVATIPVIKNEPAKFYVRYPCDMNGLGYKIFLKSSSGAVLGHVKFYQRDKTTDLVGDLYCKGAGTKTYYGGEKTDFNLHCDVPKCVDGGMRMMEVEKTTKYVKLIDASNKELLWSKMFDEFDGDCTQALGSVYSQVWGYFGNDMSLAVAN